MTMMTEQQRLGYARRAFRIWTVFAGVAVVAMAVLVAISLNAASGTALLDRLGACVWLGAAVYASSQSLHIRRALRARANPPRS